MEKKHICFCLVHDRKNIKIRSRLRRVCSDCSFTKLLIVVVSLWQVAQFHHIYVSLPFFRRTRREREKKKKKIGQRLLTCYLYGQNSLRIVRLIYCQLLKDQSSQTRSKLNAFSPSTLSYFLLPGGAAKQGMWTLTGPLHFISATVSQSLCFCST